MTLAWSQGQGFLELITDWHTGKGDLIQIDTS